MTCCTRPTWITWTLALFVFATVLGVAHAAEPTYPTRPIRLIVPYAPGGGVDAAGRIMAPKLTEAMGQNWVVDNRTGAGGNLAAEMVARASPDGHTVLVVIDTQVTANPSLYKLTFNMEKDLQPITMLSTSASFFAVNPGIQANTLKEFVALAQQKPGALNYGSGGVGTSNHLTAELLKKLFGIDMKHIAYKGAGPAVTALMGGEIQVVVSSIGSMLPFVTAGRLRALATTGAARAKVAPQVPTVAESGYPGFESLQWVAFMVPGPTPKPIAERIHNESVKALQLPDVQNAMARLGAEPRSSTQAELAARIKSESAAWAAIIKEQGISGQ